MKELSGIKLHRESIYDDKYIKTKVKLFDVVLHTNFHDSKIPRKNIHYVCCGNNYRFYNNKNITLYLEEFQCIPKGSKMINFIEAKLKLDSSDSNGSETE